jgi:hypothetical protein
MRFMANVKLGDTNAGYKVIAVKEGELPIFSIVLCEKVDRSAPTNYVVWSFSHNSGSFGSGYYEDNLAKAQKAFEQTH